MIKIAMPDSVYVIKSREKKNYGLNDRIGTK